MSTDPRLVVLQVLPRLQTGGVERGTVEMVQAIVAAGGRALVASAGGRMVDEVVAAGGVHVDLPLAGKAPWRIAANARRLARLARREGVRLIHARSRAPAWAAWLGWRSLAAGGADVHFVTTWHGVHGEEWPAKRVWNSVLAKGERVIAISHFVARQIVSRHGVGPARLRVIPRGVDVVAFDPAAVAPARVEALRLAWHLAPGRRVVMLPGRLSAWKGHATLIEALALLGDEDVVAVFAGETRGGALDGHAPLVARLAQQAAAAGLSERIVMAGHCADMPAALLLTDVVVSASLRPEPFGRVVVEAQAMGCPVVATDHGGAAETIRAGVTGWLVPPGDAPALAEALGEALDLAPLERVALAERCRAAVLAQFTTAAMQQATLAVYREVLS